VVSNFKSDQDALGSQRLAGGFDYSGSELGALTRASNYYRWLIGRFEPYLGADVLEVGAGIGTFSEMLLSVPRVRSLVAIEPAANTYPLLAARLAGNSRATAIKGYLNDYSMDSSVDSLVAVNVLEHVEDDAEFLRLAWKAVVPGGRLLLFVPAVPAIFGSLDRAFEHRRRYTKRTLTQRIKRAEWTPEKVEYMNLPGVLFWFVAARVLRWKSIPGRSAQLYDRFIIPLTRRVEDIVRIPIGQSLLAVARKSGA
jgi:SAM-dependent methyltransferase